MNVNVLDLIVLIPVLWGAFKGFKNGVISEGGTIAALVLGIWASVSFSSIGADFVAEYLSVSEQYKEIVAFGVIFLVVVILSFFVTKILNSFFKAISLEWLNKLLGVVFGAGKYLVIISFLFFLINTMVHRYSNEEIKLLSESLFFEPLAKTAEMILDGNIAIPDFELPPIVNESIIDASNEAISGE